MTTGRINQVNILHTKEDKKKNLAQTITQGLATNIPQPTKTASHNILIAYPHSHHYSQKHFLHPFGTERYNLDPHFNSPAEAEQEVNIRAERSI